MTYKFQNITFETSQTFGITNVQIQPIPLYYIRREEIIFRIIVLL